MEKKQIRRGIILTKTQFLKYWAGLPDPPFTEVAPEIAMRPIPYGHTGTAYFQDTIRLTGTREHVDAILSLLKPLLDFENDDTRLQVTYRQSTDRETGEPVDAWNCYIQVHERGKERTAAARAVNQIRKNRGYKR